MNSRAKEITVGLLSITFLVMWWVLTLIYSDPESTIRIVSIGTLCFAIGGLVGKGPFPPFTSARNLLRRLFRKSGPERFKIRIAIGESPMDLSSLDGPNACTLGPDIVTDLDALFIADPFVIIHHDRAWVFFEAMENKSRKGVICAAWSEDGLAWTYHGRVLEEAFHLSYPQVVKHDNEIWMIPESCHDYSVRLYRSDSFPDKWTHVETLLSGYCFCDNTVFQMDDSWWLYSSIGNDHLNLYQSKSLCGPWLPHTQNPVVRSGPRDSRMAGPTIYHDEKLIRVAQDCVEKYGHFVRGYKVETLSTNDYSERELANSPLLYPSPKSWKKNGCHHLAQIPFNGKWLILSDGY